MRNSTEKIISIFTYSVLGVFILFVGVLFQDKLGFLDAGIYIVQNQGCEIGLYDITGEDGVTRHEFISTDRVTDQPCDPLPGIKNGKGFYLMGIIIIIIIGILTLILVIYLTARLIGQLGLYLVSRDFGKVSTEAVLGYSILELLALMKKLLFHTKLIYYGNKFGKIDSSAAVRNKIRKIYKDQSSELLSILYQVKEKLHSEIELLQSKLVNANKELEALDSEAELLNIKKLQSARLGHQIEKFEELQRVLVKI